MYTLFQLPSRSYIYMLIHTWYIGAEANSFQLWFQKILFISDLNTSRSFNMKIPQTEYTENKNFNKPSKGETE